MRAFRLISVLFAMVWVTSALADGPGWWAWSGTYVGDPGSACNYQADQHFNTEELGSEAVATNDWYQKQCWYHHFLVAGGYNDWGATSFECPSGQVRVSPGVCMTPSQVEDRPRSIPDDGIYHDLKTSEAIDQCNASVGNPILVSNGTKIENVVDYTTGGLQSLTFRRFYRSLMSSPFGHVGMGWSSTYDRRLLLRSSTSVEVYTETGALEKFQKVSGAWIRSYSDITVELAEITAGTVFEFTNGEDRVDRFELVSGSFRLTQIRWRTGYQQDLVYVNNKLSTVTDSYGRTLTLSWDLDVIASVEAPGQYQVAYTYDRVTAGPSGLARGSELLTKVTRRSLTSGDTEEVQYLYEDPNHRHLLTGIVDANGHRYSTYEYDQYGRAVSTEHAGGAGRYEIQYDDVNLTRTVTNPLGKEAIYHFTKRQGVFKLDSIDGQASANCPAASSAQTYDSNGFVASQTDWNGNLTTYVRDAQGLETSRTEAVGEPEQRTITTTWHSTFMVPSQMAMPGLTVDLTYDSQGRLTQRTETDTTSQSAPYSTNGQTRIWTYTWNGDGELTSVDGPRTDVSDITSYAYDGAGNLVSVTNALSQQVQITSHNARNQPLSITDPNGIVTDLAYDTHGGLVKATVHLNGRDEITEISYDAAGQPISTTSSDGVRLEYEYDLAHRLTAIKNSVGERIGFTLDAMGNPTLVEIRSSSGSILKSHTRAYDELGRLLQSVGVSSQITSFEYDNNGNTVEISDPRSAVTANAFDALDRLVQSTDALTGVTEFSYDAQSNLVSVEDAKNQVTSYIYNGFGDVIQVSSPDTGVTVYEVDKAGNRTKQTDARGVVANYAYDALDRLVSVAYPTSAAEDVAFTYDDTIGGNKGVGWLTSVTDGQGSVHMSMTVRAS